MQKKESDTSRGLTGEFEPGSLLNEYVLAIIEASVTSVDDENIEVTTIDGNFRVVTEEEANKGDVNGDGEITSVDALMALQMSVGKLEVSLVADMNDDGKVKPDDALKILKLANEKSVSGQLTLLGNLGKLKIKR